MTISTAGMIEAVRAAAGMTKTQEEQDCLNGIANRIEILAAANADMDLQLNSIRSALNIPSDQSVQSGVIDAFARQGTDIAELTEKSNRLRRTAKEHQEENQLLRTELAGLAKQLPFMYGIADPDGKAYFDEFCVSADRGLVEDAVNNLNHDREEGDELNFTAVELFTRAVPQAVIQHRAEGIIFTANRLLAAWDAGFIDKPASDTLDVATVIISALEMLPDATDGDFQRDFTDEMLTFLREEAKREPAIPARKDGDA